MSGTVRAGALLLVAMLSSGAWAKEDELGVLVQSVVAQKSYFVVEQTVDARTGIVKTVEVEHPYVTGHRVFAKDGICRRYRYDVTGMDLIKTTLVDHGRSSVAESEVPRITVTSSVVSCEPFV